jgi:hypothetical protein
MEVHLTLLKSTLEIPAKACKIFPFPNPLIALLGISPEEMILNMEKEAHCRTKRVNSNSL